MFELQHPLWLLAWLVLPVVALRPRWSGGRARLLWSALPKGSATGRTWRVRLAWLPEALGILGLALLIFALARPQLTRLVGGVNQGLGLLPGEVGQVRHHLHSEAVALADRAQGDVRGDGDGPRLDLLHPGDDGQGAAKTGGVARGEELLGVGAGDVAAAEGLGGDDGEVEGAVVGAHGAVAPAGGGGGGGVQALLKDARLLAHVVLR